MRSVESDGPDRCVVGELRRIIFDTNVFVAAVTSREGVSARLILTARAGHFQLIASPMLLTELSGVLDRPKFRRYISLEDAHLFVEEMRKLAHLVDDPDDDFLVLLAETVGAEVLASGDPHLTTLQRPGLTVMAPGSFLDALNS